MATVTSLSNNVKVYTYTVLLSIKIELRVKRKSPLLYHFFFLYTSRSLIDSSFCHVNLIEASTREKKNILTDMNKINFREKDTIIYETKPVFYTN